LQNRLIALEHAGNNKPNTALALTLTVAFSSNVTTPLGITNKSDAELTNTMEMHSKMLRKMVLPSG